MADQDERHPHQAGAGHVHLAGDREVRLEEALRALPREVGVAEHHSVPGLRLLRTEPVGVRAEPAEVEPFAELGESAGSGRGGWARDQRLGRGDAVDGHARAREQGELVEAPVGVDLLDRLDPRLAAAGRVGDVRDARVAQPAVVAGHVAADAGSDLGPRAVRRRLREQLLDRARVDDALEEEVAVQVVHDHPVALEPVAPVGAEVARALGPHGRVGVRERADVGAGQGPAVAVAEPLEVAGEDVRDAEGRGAHDRVEARLAGE